MQFCRITNNLLKKSILVLPSICKKNNNYTPVVVEISFKSLIIFFNKKYHIFLNINHNMTLFREYYLIMKRNFYTHLFFNEIF